MKKIISALLFISLQTHAWVPFDFADGMQLNAYADVLASDEHQKFIGMSGNRVFNFFQMLYDCNRPEKLTRSDTPRIPKIIHQIWIGPSVPEELRAFAQTWQEQHPDWEYRLWTQHDVAEFGMTNKKFFDESRNPGEKSDLMRYEILHRYGGVYVDMDFECLQSLDELNHLYDFYIGVQPLDGGLVQVGIGLIGCVPNHPLLKKCIDSIADTWRVPEYQHMATARTGPLFFTKLFCAYAGAFGLIDVALPANYLYPLGCQEYDRDDERWLARGAFGVHHWAKTWLLPDFRRPQFRSIKNY